MSVAFLLCAGCHAATDKHAKSVALPADSPGRAARPQQVETARSEPLNAQSVQQMCIGSECVDASEMWPSLGDRLLKELRELQPELRRRLVEQRCAQWMSDRITESLLYQQASLRLPTEASENIDKYVDGELRKIITSGYGGIQRRYEKFLTSKGQTLDDVRTRLRREILVTSYLEREVKPRIAEPTRSELLAVYNANVDSWRRPIRRRMSLIDVRVLDRLPDHVNNPTRAQMAEARSAARAIIESAREALQGGEPFAEVAKRYSDGLHAAEGGSWGWVSKGSVRERFEPAVEALDQLEAGQTSRSIETEDGLFLVRCDEIDPGFEPTFANVQPELKERYVQSAYGRLIADLVADLRQKTHIEPDNLERFHAGVVDSVRRHASVAGVEVP